MLLRRIASLVLLVMCLLVLIAPAAQADHMAQAWTSAGTSESPGERNDQQFGSGAAASSDYFVDFVGSSNSYATLTGDHIQVRAAGSAGELAQTSAIRMVSQAGAEWFDDFTVTVPDGFEGTAALKVTFLFDGSLSGQSSFDLTILESDGVGNIDGSRTAYDTVDGIQQDDFGLIEPGTTGPYTVFDSLAYYAHLSPSNTVTLGYLLSVAADANLNHFESAVDFSQNSLRLLAIVPVDELGNPIPGATLQSASGFGYNVPEPGSWLLAALGLIGTLLVRRRTLAGAAS